MNPFKSIKNYIANQWRENTKRHNERTDNFIRSQFSIREINGKFYVLHNDTAIRIFSEGTNTEFMLKSLEQHRMSAIDYSKEENK